MRPLPRRRVRRRPDTVRILIADDHPLVRDGLRALLSRPGFAVVGEASSGEEAVEKTASLKPDVVILDLVMEGMDGLDALQHIKRTRSRTSVIILTQHDDRSFFWRALRDGASAYLLKGTSSMDLLLATDRIASGENLLEPHLVEEVLTRLRAVPSEPEEGLEGTGEGLCVEGKRAMGKPDPLALLTPQEALILRHMLRGESNGAISTALGVGPGTVKTHIRHIFRKLDVSDRTHLFLWAGRAGLLA